ncbi:hypothetical protein R54876_GBNLAHCA_00713 [Eupransor demetentiae]|uniref:Uncharacterized protein n=2 Tax=Eupransor demetentiae TaxID=3109584 RepID=A0ABP0EQP6_9LACO|nr:hypothetical protein R54876_GBNLAHCA_00713 [Lactobacillaceae bacterium LMG 33000]
MIAAILIAAAILTLAIVIASKGCDLEVEEVIEQQRLSEMDSIRREARRHVLMNNLSIWTK